MGDASWWKNCQAETIAFSTYYGTLSASTSPPVSKVEALLNECSENYNSDIRTLCETNNGLSSITDKSFTNFYKCIDSSRPYHDRR